MTIGVTAMMRRGSRRRSFEERIMVEQQESGDDQPPVTTNSSEGFDPGEFFTEGWGGGEATFDDVLANARILIERLRGPILIAWLMVAGGLLVFELVEAMLTTTAHALGDGIIWGLIFVVWIPLKLVEVVAYPILMVTQLSLFRPLRTRVVEGPVEADSVGRVFNEAKQRWVMVAVTVLLTSIVTMVGTVACIIPGLFATFLLWMANYLVATRDDLSPIDAMKRSATLAKKYWQVLLVAFGAMFLGAICFFMVFGLYRVLISVIGAYTGPVVFIGGALFTWAGFALWMFLAFVGMAAVYITVDLEEHGSAGQPSASSDGSDVEW